MQMLPVYMPLLTVYKPETCNQHHHFPCTSEEEKIKDNGTVACHFFHKAMIDSKFLSSWNEMLYVV